MSQVKMRLMGTILGFCLLFSLFPVGAALADPNFNLDNFRTKWQRADKPVNDLTANPGRSWLWGPEGFSPTSGVTEPYAESPGGTRTVEYFDKARMELNNPSTGLVTNGLLVRELIAGRLATGDAAYTQRRAADDIPVAGDPSGNDGPTYASFAKIATLNNDNPSTDRTGKPVVDTIDNAGRVSNNPAAAGSLKYAYFDPNLKHNIPNVFWDYMNQRGNVYVSGGLQNNQPVLGDNPAAPWLDATGLPITDAYWAKVTLAGKATDVLIQAFERRVLTYTPSNPAAYQVEMGNVGRHYFNWRYSTKYDLAPGKTCDTLPASKGSAYPFVKCGPAGMVIYAVAPMQPSENVLVTVTRPDGSHDSGLKVAKSDGSLIIGWETLTTEQGVYAFSFKGQSSGEEAETYVFLEKPVTAPTIIVSPTSGSINQNYIVMALGFNPGEGLLIKAKAPASDSPTVLVSPNPTVSKGGSVTAVLVLRTLFTGNIASYLQPGTWTFTASSTDGTRSVNATVNMTS